MHVSTKKLTVSAMLLAIAVILLYLGNVVESSTVFFLALAAFCTGIIQREYGIKSGWVFWIANMLLGLIVIPQKLYMVTFAAFSLYILLTEMGWSCLCRRVDEKKRNRMFVILRLVIFNVMYLPLVFGMPKLFLGEALLLKAGDLLYPLLLVGGQVFLVLFDRAYVYFQGVIWERIRRAIKF